jgi:hypothetical protein
VDNGKHPKARAVEQAWRQLTDEVRGAARELGVGSRSWRRCIKKLRRITKDDRWALVESNLTFLYKTNGLRMNIEDETFHTLFGPKTFFRRSFMTGSTITQYQVAVETARTEIRRLTSDFLRSSAPG